MPVSAASGTLVGSAFAEASFHGDAVADVAALTAIVASNRFDRQERTVEIPLNQYVFDEQSAAASNPPDILVPDDSPATGRWIRLVPGGGVPASHAASHSDGGSDEITVENLATSEVSTTKSLMPDGAGGLVFGAPAPAAHLLGGALHTADTLANLNTKISDATLVDSSAVMLLDGTQSMTGTLTAREIVVEQIAGSDPVDNTTALDSRKLAFENRIWDGVAVTRSVFVRNEGLTGANDIFQLTISADRGGSESDYLAIRMSSSTITRVMAPGKQLAILSGDANTAITIAATGMDVTFGGNVDLASNGTLRFGSTQQVQFEYDTQQANDGLLIGTEGPATGNYILITDKSKIGQNRALPTFSNPTLVIEDGGASVGNWGSFAHDGTNFVIKVNAGAILLAGGNVISDGDATRELGGAGARWSRVTTNFLRADVIETGSGFDAITFSGSNTVFNEGGLNAVYRFEGTNDINLLTTNGVADRVGVGLAVPTGKLHVDQNAAAGAIPVLVLDQGDDSEEMIEFIGTIGIGNAIEAVGAKSLTTTHFIKVTIPGGLTRYFPVGTIA